VVETPAQLAALVERLNGSPRIAVDTEADSLHAYPEKVCLIQVAGEGFEALVDPLAGLDLAPLWQAFGGRMLVFHGADYDLRMLRRGHAFVPESVFDTMLAARLTGRERFGLDALLETELGVRVEKRSQKADWGRRPLTPRMTEYAINDVRLLLPLADRLEADLERLGRRQWHAEMCARLVRDCAVVREPDPDRVWRVRGSRDLSRRELAVLRELWFWREEVARERSRPPYFVMSHELLVAWARWGARRAGPEPQLPRGFSERRRHAMDAAIARGRAVPDAECPGPLRGGQRSMGDTEQRLQRELEERRDRAAAELRLDATLIASRASLAEVVRDGPESAELMPWQRGLLGL
jgi:ribonuclease D